MALRNNNVNMADGGNTHDRSKLRMQRLKKAEPEQRPTAPTAATGNGLYRRGSGLGTGPVGRSFGAAVPNTGTGSARKATSVTPITPANPVKQTIKRPTNNAARRQVRQPSAGLNPVKPATGTQGRKKNDPWNSPW